VGEAHGEDHWLTDPRFKDDQGRGDNGSSSPSACGLGRRAHDLRGPCDARGGEDPAGPLYSPQQALDDPHIRAAGLLRDTDYPGLPRPAPLAPTPVDLSETPGRFRQAAPTLGEHTDAILAELGYDADAIAECAHGA